MILYLFHFFLFISFGLILNNAHYLVFLLFILVLLVFLVWNNNEGWFTKSALKMNKLEYSYIVISMGVMIILTTFKISILWIIFIFEFQSFIILGSCYLFKNESIKVKEIEGSLNYIIPAFLSFILLLIYVLGVNFQNKAFIYSNSFLLNIILIVSILTKVGAFPFYFWVPNVYKGITWSTLLFISVISKVFIIIFILFYIPILPHVMVIIGFITLLVAGLYMACESKIKKYLAFSSIAHIGWLILCLSNSNLSIGASFFTCEEIVVIFFFTYTFNFVLLCSNLKLVNSNKLYNLFSSIRSEKQIFCFFFSILISLFSMAGIPPFAGFIAKFLIFINIYYSNILICYLLVFISCLFIFVYIRPVVNFYKTATPYSYLLYQLKKNKELKKITLMIIPFLMYLNLLIMFIIFYV
jgi:NADH-quinone oxidoreductase subunit N